MMNGMTGSKIKQVYLNVDNRTLDIEKVSLFRKKIKAIPLSRLRVDLRLDEGKKGTSGQKLKLLFYDADHEIAELKSDYKTNKKVEQLYYTLKEVTQRL